SCISPGRLVASTMSSWKTMVQTFLVKGVGLVAFHRFCDAIILASPRIDSLRLGTHWDPPNSFPTLAIVPSGTVKYIHRRMDHRFSPHWIMDYARLLRSFALPQPPHPPRRRQSHSRARRPDQAAGHECHRPDRPRQPLRRDRIL